MVIAAYVLVLDDVWVMSVNQRLGISDGNYACWLKWKTYEVLNAVQACEYIFYQKNTCKR